MDNEKSRTNYVFLNLKKGDLFNSIKEFENLLEEETKKSCLQYYRRDSCRIETAKKVVNRYLDPNLEYYHLNYSCIYGDKNFIPTGQGKRNSRTPNQECPAHIILRVAESGNQLEVIETNNLHNHIIDQRLFQHLPHYGKLPENVTEQSKNKLWLNSNKHLVRRELENTSGQLVKVNEPSSTQMRSPHQGRMRDQRIAAKEWESKAAPSKSAYLVQRDALPEKERRISMPSLPEKGQPGGTDDPLRRGLSGAGVRWYIRYLNQGIVPEEAKKKALEHKSHGAEQKIPPSVEKLFLPQRQEQKKRKMSKITTTAEGSCASAVKATRIAILPKTFPETILSSDEQTTLEEAIVEEMYSGWEHKIKFGGIHFRPGMILVDCETPQSAEWLRRTVPSLKGWNGVELSTCAGDDIFKAHIATFFLPRSQGQVAEKLLKLIEAQNDGLNTTQWKVLNLKDVGKGQLLKVGIDDISCQKIKENGYTIHYRFGKIPVRGLGKKEEAIPSTSMEDNVDTIHSPSFFREESFHEVEVESDDSDPGAARWRAFTSFN